MPFGSARLSLRTSSSAAPLRILACALLAAVALAHAQSAPSITIDPYTNITGGSVNFTVAPAIGPIAFSTIPSQNLQDVDMTDPSYQAALDRSSMVMNKWNNFQFTLYLNRASQFQNQVYSYQVTENPNGSFTDLVAPVNIRLSTGDLLGHVPLPLHTAFGPAGAMVPVPVDPPPQPVSTAIESDPSITLKNQMIGLSAILGTPSVDIDCSNDCLQTATATLSSNTNAIDPGDQVTVHFKLVPRMGQAVFAAPHGTLKLTLPVTSSEGGNTHNQLIDVPILFHPSLWFLIPSIIVGTLLGGGIRSFLQFSQTKQWLWKEFILGLIYALVTWAVAYALFTAGGTKITLVGVSLDPTQLFQASLLCLLAGAGPAFLKHLDNSALKNLPGRN